jgi:hypothetical protein
LILFCIIMFECQFLSWQFRFRFLYIFFLMNFISVSTSRYASRQFSSCSDLRAKLLRVRVHVQIFSGFILHCERCDWWILCIEVVLLLVMTFILKICDAVILDFESWFWACSGMVNVPISVNHFFLHLVVLVWVAKLVISSCWLS